jgi:hypothetical protein
MENEEKFSIYLFMKQYPPSKEHEEGLIKKFMLTENFDEAFRIFLEESQTLQPKPLHPKNLLVNQNGVSFILQCIPELEKVLKLEEEISELKSENATLRLSNQKALETAMILMKL